MADVESYPFARSRAGSLIRPLSGIAQAVGRANGRIDYALNETVVRVDVPERVIEAKKALEASKPDILGLKTFWNQTVAPNPRRWGKHCIVATDEKLSNTLLPTHVHNCDLRKGTGPTFSPGRGSGAFDRGATEWSTSSSSWNTSVITADPTERLKTLESETLRSKARTSQAATKLLANRQSVSAGMAYVSPVQRQKLIVEHMREHKRNQGKDYLGLVRKWGKEGADHLMYIEELETKLQQRGSPLLSGIKLKPLSIGTMAASRCAGSHVQYMKEVLAVKALDKDLGDNSEAEEERRQQAVVEAEAARKKAEKEEPDEEEQAQQDEEEGVQDESQDDSKPRLSEMT
ncbi:hypothetical protein CEUSTIGMA_g4488.t1 [Chlamydomonas eustigma]|uniref:Uncharacterized protein n=1 Tax=Chlamydomonas eustigma TaxID=1157962 RepID=A0A250X1U2_9CHLO|nr:hypothetical protein CEUSTIGMA_g4488.t1 [Chlamydomonas eustigma]|eukprot:GAX77041.1 hypothetical protein CEUSTIGMA_g4488.t1 [Chlamydomonas eustigma]